MSPTTLNIISWSVAALLALSGVALLFVARFTKRRGTNPFCRKCGYDLSGQPESRDGSNCPECGAALSAAAIVRGVRPRKRKTLITGATMLLLGLLMLGTQTYTTAKKINLYPYYSERLLVHWASDAPKPATRRNSWLELVRRYDNDGLSVATVDAMVDLGLDAQNATKMSDPWWRLNFVAKLFNLDRLKPSQQERYFDQALKITPVEIRPNIEAGRRFFYTGDYYVRLGSDVNGEVTYYEPVRYLGWVRYDAGLSKRPVTIGFGWDYGFQFPFQQICTKTLGVHEFVMEFKLRIFRNGEVVGERTVSATREYEVVEKAPLADIELVSDDEIDSAFGDHVTACFFRSNQASESRSAHTQRTEFGSQIVSFIYNDLPVESAFTVIVRVNGTNYRLPGRILELGTRSSITIRSFPFDFGKVEWVRLATNRRQVYESTNLDRIWGKDLIFRDVPVRETLPMWSFNRTVAPGAAGEVIDMMDPDEFSSIKMSRF